MKTIKFAFPLLLCLMFLGIFQAEAQRKPQSAFTDSLLYAKDKLPGGGPLFNVKNMNAGQTFSIPVSSKKQVTKPSASTIKVLGLTSATKVLNTPIRLKRGNDCFEIRCSKNACQGCKMLWKDLNKDGKVQPRKEVRCVCLKTRELCQVEGRRVSCKK